VAGLIDRLVRALAGDTAGAAPPAPSESARITAYFEETKPARPPEVPPAKVAALEQSLRDARDASEELERRLRVAERERDEQVRQVAALDEQRRLLEGRVADLARGEKRAEDALREAEARLARRAKRETEPDAEAERRERLERRARTAELSAENLAERLERAEAELRTRAAADLERSDARDSDATSRLRAGGEELPTSLPCAKRTGLQPMSRLEVLFSPGPDCLEGILGCIRSARRTIDVCVFTITDDRIAEALLDAHEQRVSVRVITDNDKASDRGSDVWKLERRGIPVRVDRTEFHMHHKFAVFDGRVALTGSYNWTRGASRDNEENLVICDAAPFVAAFQQEFERLWDYLDRS
jgi:phosphatidylserine/phosphatidylglycerophosphate/cardiolipin synthase-like enzyme